MSSFTIKPVPSVKELKILLLKISFGVLFVVFGIFGVFSDTLAFPDAWNDNFELYNTGDLQGQGNWVGSDRYDVTTNVDYVFSGSKGVIRDATDSIGLINKVIAVEDYLDSSILDGDYYLNFSVKTGSIYSVKYLEVRIYGSYGFIVRNLSGYDYTMRGYGYSFECDTGDYIIGPTLVFAEEIIAGDSWVTWNLKYDLTENLIWISWTIDGELTEYSKDTNICFWPSGSPREDVIFADIELYGIRDMAFDYLNNTSMAQCDFDNCTACEEWFECQVVGCCWFYQPWYPPPLDNYCDVCEGECSYPYNCGLCATETTCEATGCFWTGDYCTQFEWECGPELACQFCLNQETCEAEDCNWNTLSQTCWYAVPTLPSSWSTYYDTHGGYDTPAEFVNELAQTTGEILAVVSGLFEGFLTSFNTADALAKGSAMGNVIPKGRGYLKVFDGLFGHYPIGETFIFILIFMLAIGLFRISRQLISLVKP